MHNLLNREFKLKQILSGARYALLLILCALIVSSCGLNAPRRTQQATPTAIDPTPKPKVSQPVTLRSLHMFDTNKGWAIGVDNRVLTTTKGVQEWVDVTPELAGQKYTIGVTHFLNAQFAWLAIQMNDKFSLLRTYDGGKVWYESPLTSTSGGGIKDIYFANQNNGWLLFSRSLDDKNEKVSVLQTIDGGVTWTLQAISNGDKPDSIGIADTGQKTGLYFPSSSIGWLTSTLSANQQTGVYATRDGGFTWKWQPLTSITENVNTARTLLTPTLFNAEEGILPVVIAPGEKNELAFYSTKDAGKTWQLQSTTNKIASPFVFPTAQQGWAAGSNTQRAEVYTTTTSGKTWQTVSALPTEIARVEALHFISATTGWVVGATKSNTNQLLQTTDAGKTWIPTSTTALK